MLGQGAQADDPEQAQPQQDHRLPRLSCQHAVDHDLQHREDATERANAHREPSIAEYWSPPTKMIARSGEHRHAERHDPADEAHCGEAQEQGAQTRLRDAHRREGEHHHELGQEQHRLDQDQSAGVETGLVPVQHVARDQDVDVGEREEREQRVGVVERLPATARPAAVLLGGFAGLARMPECEPADHHRHVRAMATPSSAANSVGRHRISAVPMTSRGTPAAM